MTKGIRLAALGCTAMLAASAAQAQTRGGFEIGAELFDYSYRERVDGETVVRDDGTMKGVTLSYTQRLGGGWFVRPLVGLAGGSVRYQSEDGTVRIPQRFARFDLNFGRDFDAGGGVTLTPFTGLNGRLQHDRGAGLETDLGLLGYDREVFYLSAPLGLTAGIPLGARARLALTGQFNLLIAGDVTSKFSGVDPDLPDLEFDLKRGRGLEASAIVSLPVGRRQALNVGPFVRHWNIGQTDSVIIANPDDPTEALELFEPRSRTTEFGIRLSFSF